MELKLEIVENQVKKIIDEINKQLGLNANITINTCPYDVGISSQILISVMAKLEDILKISIPDNCYIFYEKASNKQLSIKEASIKLIKIAK
jgi:acyl carrier protein